jgi:NAD+ synthase (glutamine-hydrolysing)
MEGLEVAMPSDFARVAAASVRVHLGDVERNTQEILARVREMEQQGVQLCVFPELCVTGYTLGDLLAHEPLQRAAFEAMKAIAAETGDMAVVVGLPIRQGSRLFNCAAVLQGGKVRGVVPKVFLPNGNEFYETRWFVSGTQAEPVLRQDGVECPFAPHLLFDTGAFAFAVEICEDVWVPMPPSNRYAMEGAEIIVNPSASDALVSKHAYRREMLRQQSGRLYAGYAYAGAGFGESTSDLAFCGYTGVYENGRALAEGKRFQLTGDSAVADVDLQRLRYHRQRNGSFHQMGRTEPAMVRVPLAVAETPTKETLLRKIEPLPFVPGGAQGDENREEIVRIQCLALATRLAAIGCQTAVIGVSGGLDSTLALLVGARAFDLLGLPRAGLTAVTMPGMGTGVRTKTNADRLMAALGVTVREISIEAAVRQHFADIGHDENDHSVVYENSQARERTQILMDIANQVNGIVLGTGDMSEAALGFSTYNGDHMSMYNVNCSVPKTLVKSLVKYVSEQDFGGAVQSVCQDIIDTPISPELLPVSAGELAQRTEDILGDYALHDFFLYHMLDSGSGPDRLHLLARQAFAGVYDAAKIDAQLSTFVKRFFAQQYKRNCVPDGPKVGSISLSPRGDWRMPADMSGALWKSLLKAGPKP